VDAKRGHPGGHQQASVHGHGAALPHCINLISYWHFQKITALHKLSLLLNVIQQEIRTTKSAMLASTAALALAFTAPIAFARAVTGSPGVLLADHSMSASKLVGMKVFDSTGVSIGTVADVLVTDKAAEPSMILSVGASVSTGTKLVTMPPGRVKVEGGKDPRGYKAEDCKHAGLHV
jgi:hypothetical protein